MKEAKKKAETERKLEENRLAGEKLETEKKAWIETHGSDYLKRAFAGYNCQRLYVVERAAKEFPDFEVDFDNKAAWNERSMPSEEALDIEEKLKAAGVDNVKIVWLTETIEENYEFKPSEAVVIRLFLGKYDLVHTM